jgi:uncharacterized protein (TIGR00288 family)
MEEQVAVYIDFENLVISAEEIFGRCDLAKVLGAAEKYGRCVIKRAYGDWTRFSRYRQEMMEQGVDLTQLFRYGAYSKKNAADIVMAVDALEAGLMRTNIQTFVLVTGDSDFSAVARKLREYGRRVVGIGLRDATSEVLVRSCDDFIIYDALIEEDELLGSFDVEQARQLLLKAMRQLTVEEPRSAVSTSGVQSQMLKLDPTFDETLLGFRQFRQFLEAQRDLLVFRSSSSGIHVALRSTGSDRSQIDQTLQYRTALNTAGFRLVEHHIRQEILLNLHAILCSHPGRLTWTDMVLRAKEQYDSQNLLRSREEIQDVARLIKLANVLEPRPQSWELDPLTLIPDLAAQEFVLRCDSVYLTVLAQKNLPLKPALLSNLLYGKMDQEEEIGHLLGLAQENQPESMTTAQILNGYQWPRHLAESKEIQVILRDLAQYHLDEESSLDAANRLNDQGLRIRTADFERARIYFLKAARMMYELLRERQPGASLMDLEWYMASYCASTAGAFFSRHNYEQALAYYLAFFALVKETEPVWDKVRKLVPPMLSFYFTIAPNEFNDQLKVSPGRTHPARLAVLLHSHRNSQIRERWLEMVQTLVRINPALIRGVIQRLNFLEEDEQPGEDTEATLQTLNQMLAQATKSSPSPEDEQRGAEAEIPSNGHAPQDTTCQNGFSTARNHVPGY